MVYTSIARCVASLGLLQTAAHQVAMQVFWTLSFFSEPLNIAAQSLIALHAGHPKVHPPPLPLLPLLSFTLSYCCLTASYYCLTASYHCLTASYYSTA